MGKRGKNYPGLRVLFLGSTEGTSTSVFYYTNLIKLGHLVYAYDADALSTRNLFEKAHLKWYHRPTRKRVNEVSSNILSLVKRYPFDLIFVMTHNFIPADTLNEIKKITHGRTTLVYHSHDNNFYPGVLTPDNFAETMRAFDFVFTTKSQNVEKYRLIGQSNVHYIPSAFEPSVHCPMPDSSSRYATKPLDVTFIGTYDRSRDAHVQAIGWQNLTIWGSHWKRYKLYHVHQRRIHPYPVYFSEYSDIVSHSKISLGLLRQEAADRHTQRTFEIPACGTLQIAPREPEILQYFKEDKEIVCFATPEELRDKTLFYLRNEKARQLIARRGQLRVHRDGHTYLARVQEILKLTAPTVVIRKVA